MPPYSPDFNPIEQAFSVMKARLCQDGSVARAYWEEKDDSGVREYLKQLAMTITEEEAQGFFHHSGLDCM